MPPSGVMAVIMIINGHDFAVNAAFEEMLAESLKVRPCSYDPTKHLEVYTDSTGAVNGFGLPLSCKRLWFAAYCNETGKVGQIIPDLIDRELKRIDAEDALGNPIPRYYTSAKADVYLDGELVGSGFASYCFPRTEEKISNANQVVTGLAISKALSNAGFGVVDRGDLADPAPKGPSAADLNSPLPYTVGENAGPIPTAPANPAPESAAPAQNQQMEMQNLFAQLGGKDDELTRAKQTPYPMNGYYKGQPMGGLPASKLEYFVTKEFKDPAMKAAQDAARLILEDRKKANGKANN